MTETEVAKPNLPVPDNSPTTAPPPTACQKALAGWQPFDLKFATETAPCALNFAFPGMKKGTVGAIVGTGGSGKSIWALMLSTSIASGHNVMQLPESEFPALKVAYLSLEDGDDVVHQRIYAIAKMLPEENKAAFLENLQIIPIVGRGFDIMESSWREWLVTMLPRGSVLFIDTARRAHNLEENDSGEMATFVNMLEEICRVAEVTIVFLHHTSKAGALNGSSDQQASRGSSVLTDNCRLQLNLSTMTVGELKLYNSIPEDERRSYVRLTYAKKNYGPPVPDRWLRRGPGGLLTWIDMPAPIAPAKTGRAQGAGKRAATAVDEI